jgi:HPt (histidine-containing phosphotransfer) domain-containing protein
MDAFLTKPLNLAELHSVLRQWHQGGPSAATVAPAAAVTPAAPAPIDAAPLERPPIDRADLARILGDDDPAQLDRIVRAFCHSWQESLAAIEHLLERRDAPGLAEAAHAAKGIAQYGAAGRLAAAAGELEALARAENWTQAAASVRYLNSETRRLEAFLTSSGLMGHEQLKTA